MKPESQSWYQFAEAPQGRKKLSIFLVCLFFSSIFWLFIKLSQQNISAFHSRIEIINVPANISFTAQTDSLFQVSVQSTGIKLMQVMLKGRRDSLYTDFSMLQKNLRSQSQVYYLTANQAANQLAQQLSVPRSLLQLSPDTIFFTAYEAFSKKVPLRLQTELSFAPRFKIYQQIQISPDSIEVRGPLWLQDSIREVSLGILAASNVDSDITRNLKPENPWSPHGVRFNKRSIKVFVSVEEYTETQMELSVQHNCPELNSLFPGGKMMLFPDKVTAFFLVALKDVKDLNPAQFVATVVCPDSLATDLYRLEVRISEMPPSVELLKIRPQQLEFIMIKE